jgi:hypothetical protein
MILYLEDPEVSIRRLLDMINTFSKAAGFKNQNIKCIKCLYTNNEFDEKEIRQTIMLNSSSSKKIPGNKPNQGCKRSL